MADKPILCRIGLHRWSFTCPAMLGSGALETCKRCHQRRIMHFAGAYIYLPEESTNG